MYHVFNGNEWSKHTDLKHAIRAAEDAIDVCRDACDPEWPDRVNNISIYEAPASCEAPDEDGKLILSSQECSVQEAPVESGCDYYCDYKLDTPIQ